MSGIRKTKSHIKTTEELARARSSATVRVVTPTKKPSEATGSDEQEPLYGRVLRFPYHGREVVINPSEYLYPLTEENLSVALKSYDRDRAYIQTLWFYLKRQSDAWNAQLERYRAKMELAFKAAGVIDMRLLDTTGLDDHYVEAIRECRKPTVDMVKNAVENLTPVIELEEKWRNWVDLANEMEAISVSMTKRQATIERMCWLYERPTLNV